MLREAIGDLMPRSLGGDEDVLCRKCARVVVERGEGYLPDFAPMRTGKWGTTIATEETLPARR